MMSVQIPGLIFLFSRSVPFYSGPGWTPGRLTGLGQSQKRATPTVCLPHGVEDGSVLHDAEQLVGRGHVVRDGPLAIAEEGVRCPDLADHQVVEPQDLDGALKLEPLVDPGLAKEHIHGVLLAREPERGEGVGFMS